MSTVFRKNTSTNLRINQRSGNFMDNYNRFVKMKFVMFLGRNAKYNGPFHPETGKPEQNMAQT